jgi:predicted TIM-barrel fold metal-dependent hydrolase
MKMSVPLDYNHRSTTLRTVAWLACSLFLSPAAWTKERPDAQLLALINQIKAVDNHSHALPVPSQAALDNDIPNPLGTSAPFMSVRQRESNTEWIDAWRALYAYQQQDADAAHVQEALRAKKDRIRAQGAAYPAWVLDQIRIDVVLINAPTLGTGQTSPRFLWVPYADGFLFPFQAIDFQGSMTLQQRRTQVGLGSMPPAWMSYLKLITQQLTAWKANGAVAVKFAISYYRPLDFARVADADAERIYERYLALGEQRHDYHTTDYRALQDFLLRYVLREAGRIGLPVHIHTGEGAGPAFPTAGSNPLLLEGVLNDFSLARTIFVLVHGGFPFDREVVSLIQKPNVYVDISGQTFFRSANDLSDTLRPWLYTFPEKIMFGTDAFTNTWLRGWEEMTWIATRSGRIALALALTRMMAAGEITRVRAEEVARMVLRENAVRLYQLTH